MKLSIERVVVLFTPVFAAASAWLSGAVARYGIHLDKTQVAAVMIAGATAAAGAAIKWLDGRQKLLAAEKQAEVEIQKASPVIKELDPDLMQQIKTLVTQGVNDAANAITGADAHKVPASPVVPAA